MADGRICVSCGQRYYRRNIIEVWTVRNEGSRAGWVKRRIRQCLTCQPVTRSVALLRVAHVAVNVRIPRARSAA